MHFSIHITHIGQAWFKQLEASLCQSKNGSEHQCTLVLILNVKTPLVINLSNVATWLELIFYYCVLHMFFSRSTNHANHFIGGLDKSHSSQTSIALPVMFFPSQVISI